MDFPADVSDVRSNPQDQIAHAATVLRKSEARRKVFRFIYRGKSKVKTVSEIAEGTGLSDIQVLKQGRALADNRIVKQTKVNKKTAYEKDRFYSQKRNRILSLAESPQKLARFPTKVNPRALRGRLEVIRLPKKLFDIQRITLDDIDSFRKVRTSRKLRSGNTPIPETVFKRGIQKILGEKGRFEDWGGEKNDLYTSRLKIDGRRRTAAFGFKGKGLDKKLTPRYMGKNGDQIQRLFQSSAQVFIIQHWREIDQSVVEQMEVFAKVKSLASGEPILFGSIDGEDTNRLLLAYPKEFS